MKLSNPLSSMQSGYKSRLLSYPVLFVLATLEFGILLIIFGPIFRPDTITYIDAAYSIVDLQPDLLRTPAYPLIMALFRGIFGALAWTWALCIAQFAIALCAVLYFYKIADCFIRNHKIAFWLIAIYMLYPGIMFFSYALLTESIAASVMVFFVWNLLRRYPQSPASRDVLWATCWLIFLLFLRPALLCLLPVTIVFYVLIFPRLRGRGTSTVCTALGGLLLIIVMIIGYKCVVHERYGIQSVSAVSTINNYFALKYAGIIEPEVASDPALQSILSRCAGADFDSISAAEYDFKMYVRHNPAVAENYVNTLMAKYPSVLVEAVLARWAYEASQHNMLYITEWNPANIWENILLPDMSIYFSFLLIFTVITLISWHRCRHVPVATLFCLMICGSIFMVSIVGAQSEWSRLNVPALPIALLLIGKCVSLFKRNSEVID